MVMRKQVVDEMGKLGTALDLILGARISPSAPAEPGSTTEVFACGRAEF